jgi:imidazolonepropionase-like amidohydrolase
MTQTLYAGGKLFTEKGRCETGLGLLVEGDTIKRLAPLSEFTGYAGERVDTSGATVLPGLIDCHVHLIYTGSADPQTQMEKSRPQDLAVQALVNAQSSLRGGITAVRDCGGKDYIEFAARDACNSGRFLGPTVRAAGRMICMTGGHGNRIARVADGPDDVVKAVREQVHAGSDLIKIMATGGVMTPGVDPQDAHYSAEEMKAGIAEGHRFRKPCASHAQGRDGILNAVRGGIDSIEHGIFMDEQCCEEMMAAGTTLVPTLAAIRNILAYKDKGVPAFIVEKSERVAEQHRRAITMFYKAGGRIAMGTDAGTPFNYHGENAMELAYMADIGIAPADAIVISTRNAAELNRLERQGRLAEGCLADLLIVEGDPVEDIQRVAQRRHHRAVVKAGQRISQQG